MNIQSDSEKLLCDMVSNNDLEPLYNITLNINSGTTNDVKILSKIISYMADDDCVMLSNLGYFNKYSYTSGNLVRISSFSKINEFYNELSVDVLKNTKEHKFMESSNFFEMFNNKRRVLNKYDLLMMCENLESIFSNFPETVFEKITVSKVLKKIPDTIKILYLRIVDLEQFMECNDMIFSNPNLQILILDRCLCTSIRKFPPNLKYFKFEDSFNGPISGIPNTLETIIFGPKYNTQIDWLNSRLKKIKFGNNFNLTVNNLPDTLNYLCFGYYFNKSVDNLPQGIKYLEFKHNFNQLVNNLPSSIIFLKFGFEFNQSVNNLPCGIKYLEFGRCFNQSVDYLPSSIKYISFGDNFNQSIDDLPCNLINIYISSSNYNNFNRDINLLSYNLNKIVLHKSYRIVCADDYYEKIKNKYPTILEIRN